MTTFRTSDLHLASALKTVLDLPAPAIKVSERHSEFIFQVDPKEARRVAEAYYGDKLSANLRSYASNLRDIKTLIFQARTGSPL